MIRVGFFLNFPLDYKGGINYLRNLLYAIKKFPEGQEAILFVPANIPEEYITSFAPFATIIKTKVIQRKTLPWLADKIFEKTFTYNPLMVWLISRYKIDVISHANFTAKGIKTINWIPDFQYVRYPDLWNEHRLRETTLLHRRLAIESDLICLSSRSAFSDFKKKYNEYSGKVFVLHFVSQPENGVEIELSDEDRKELFGRYNIDRPYFYLPNQFWVHKNHKVAWNAIRRLKEGGHDPLLITSGFMSDSRNRNEHVVALQKFIEDHGLQKNIYLLGLIPYRDVIRLLIGSKCVINPSHFEGWSSTVEEAKTLGKRIILSDIDVHIEQKPEFGVYFSPDDDAQLAGIMSDILSGKIADPVTDKSQLLRDLDNRTQAFAKTYLEAVKRLLSR